MDSDERRSTTQQTCETKLVKIKNLMPSAREVIIDQLPSLGRAVTTANGSTLRTHGSISTVLAMIFHFFQAFSVKTGCLLHWTAEIETAGLTVKVQQEILRVNAIFCVQI